jgi:hypothetical protein
MIAGLSTVLLLALALVGVSPNGGGDATMGATKGDCSTADRPFSLPGDATPGEVSEVGTRVAWLGRRGGGGGAGA